MLGPLVAQRAPRLRRRTCSSSGRRNGAPRRLEAGRAATSGAQAHGAECGLELVPSRRTAAAVVALDLPVVCAALHHPFGLHLRPCSATGAHPYGHCRTSLCRVPLHAVVCARLRRSRCDRLRGAQRHSAGWLCEANGWVPAPSSREECPSLG